MRLMQTEMNVIYSNPIIGSKKSVKPVQVSSKEKQSKKLGHTIHKILGGLTHCPHRRVSPTRIVVPCFQRLISVTKVGRFPLHVEQYQIICLNIHFGGTWL